MQRYFTVKEISKIIEVSKPTIQKAINNKKIEADHSKGQYRYYNLEQVKEIIREIYPGFDFSVFAGGAEEPPKSQNEVQNPQTEPKILQNEVQNPQTEPPKPPTTQNQDALQKALEIMQKELENKNEQIKDLQQQLTAANSQISSLASQISDLAKAASYITAADKTAKIIDQQQKESEEEQGKKKKWFQFWKK